MRGSDKHRAQAHLNEAVRHLAAASIVVQHLDRDAELARHERVQFGDITSVVASLVGQVDAALRGRALELDLTDIVVSPNDATKGAGGPA